MKRKPLTTNTKRLRAVAEQAAAKAAMEAYARGSADGVRAAEKEIERRLTRDITARPDETTVLGGEPGDRMVYVRLQSSREHFLTTGRGPRMVEARFVPVKKWWRCEDTGALVVWWEWQHQGSRAMPEVDALLRGRNWR